MAGPVLTVRGTDTDGAAVALSRLTVRDSRTKALVYRGRPVRLNLSHEGPYLVTVEARAYRRAQRILLVRRSHTERVTLLAQPEKVRPVFGPFEMPAGFGEPARLSDPRRACLRNLLTKIAVTPVVDRYLERMTLRRIKRDRIWTDAPRSLRRSVLGVSAWRSVSGALHPSPPGYTSVLSVKTGDRVGNLQLTFFESEDPSCSYDICEIDIDNSSGLAHAVDVAKHTITGAGTHPYDIREILVHWQGLDPGYRLVPR